MPSCNIQTILARLRRKRWPSTPLGLTKSLLLSRLKDYSDPERGATLPKAIR